MRIRRLTVTAMLAALCCVIAPLSIPVGAVPVSLALFAVCLTAALCGPMLGTTAVAVYIALGALGLPVFAGFTGGAGHIAGVTGGYIIGYLPCALIVGLLTRGEKPAFWRYPVGMALGTLACYAVGSAWFMAATGSDVAYTLGVCVAPFIIWDALKIAAASLICPRLRMALRKLAHK